MQKFPTGAVWLKVCLKGKRTEIKRTPIIHNEIKFIAGGFTFGVNEDQIKKLRQTSSAYYDITSKFFKAEGDPMFSTGYDVETLREFLQLSTTPEWLQFTRLDDRPEVKLLREELGGGEIDQ